MARRLVHAGGGTLASPMPPYRSVVYHIFCGAPEGFRGVDDRPVLMHTLPMKPVNRLLTLLSLTTVVITLLGTSATRRAQLARVQV